MLPAALRKYFWKLHDKRSTFKIKHIDRNKLLGASNWVMFLVTILSTQVCVTTVATHFIDYTAGFISNNTEVRVRCACFMWFSEDFLIREHFRLMQNMHMPLHSAIMLLTKPSVPFVKCLNVIVKHTGVLESILMVNDNVQIRQRTCRSDIFLEWNWMFNPN